MDQDKPRRRQCAKCPWKAGVNPNDIPGGYCATKHAALSRTIADPGDIRGSSSMMACHETPPGKEVACVGWLVHQLGPGNNLGLRLRAAFGELDTHVETVGPQHERFEDTLPRRKRSATGKAQP